MSTEGFPICGHLTFPFCRKITIRNSRILSGWWCDHGSKQNPFPQTYQIIWGEKVKNCLSALFTEKKKYPEGGAHDRALSLTIAKCTQCGGEVEFFTHQLQSACSGCGHMAKKANQAL